MPSSSATSQSSQSARARDPERLIEELYAALEGRLTSVLFRVLWDAEEVREVIQEAFVRLWRMRDRIDWSRPEPLAYRIALNLASNRRRSRRIWRWVSLDGQDDCLPDGSGNPEQSLEDAEQRAAFREALDALPDKHRRVLLMCTFSDLDQAAIGAALGIPAGTVGSRRHAAIEKLKRRLAPWEEG